MGIALNAPRDHGLRRTGKPPSALTERRLKLICEKVANGVPQSTAAIRAGVPRRTYQEWLAKGRLEDAVEPYRSMAERVDAALAIYHESRIDELHASAAQDPRVNANVMMWELDRRFRDDWGDPGRGGVTINNQTNVVVIQEAASELLAAAGRALDGYPDLLERLKVELAGPDVVSGEAVEVAELVPVEATSTDVATVG